MQAPRRRKPLAGALCLAAGTYWAWKLNGLVWAHFGSDRGERLHVLWPAALLLMAVCAALALAQSLLLPIPPADEKPVRRPPGAVALVDNRLGTGAAIVGLAVLQAALFAAWSCISKHHDLCRSVQAQLSVFVAMATIVYFAAFASNRQRIDFVGLFPWPLPLLAAAQALAGMAAMYSAFFTIENGNVPMWGRSATANSNLLTTTTLVATTMLLLHASVQRRAMYVRTDNVATSEISSQEHQDERTPLARCTDVVPSQLPDTPEYSESLLSRLLFLWPSGLLKRGARRQLDAQDLYHLGPSDDPLHNWKRYMRHRKPGRPVITTVALTFAPELSLQALLAIGTTFIHYAGPFFLQRILRTIEQRGEGESMRHAYLDAFGLLVFALVETTMFGQSLWIGRHIGIRVKGLLVTELSAKTLQRRGGGEWEDPDKDEEAKDKGDDDEDSDMQASSNGRIMNLMTADLNRVADVAAYVDDLYAMPLSLLIGVWYMYALLGPSAIMGLAVAVVYVPLSKVVFQYTTRLDTRYNALGDERLAAITELLQGIKAVKLFGWESRFRERIDEKRERQLGCMWQLNVAWLVAIGVTSLAPMLVLVVIFTMYTVVFEHQLSAEIAFTSISVFQLVRVSFEFLPGMLSWSIGAYVSLKRIGSYLGQPDVQRLDERVRAGEALGFDSADLAWDAPAEASSSEETPLLESERLAPGAFVLRGLNVEFPRGGLTVVAGPTGAGKSSLLSALVGEMTLLRGHVLAPVVSVDGKLAIHDIAYVAQEAWLRNATIRENILFGEAYDAERYESVLRACALKPDLRILRAGDATEIGERGVTLSGGQKQRVALARAVYSHRRILLIDDCLSAVDAHTARHILHACLVGGSALMQGRTRVLVTHHVAACLPHADYAVLMRGGAIAHQGLPSELQAQGLFAESMDGHTSDDEQNEDALAAAVVNDAKTEDEYTRERAGHEDGTLIEEEERETGRVKADIWLRYFSACGGLRFWGTTLATLIAFQGATMMQDYWIRIWVASAGGTADQNTHPQRSAVFWMSIYVALGLAGVLLSVAKAGCLFAGALNASRTLHAQLVQAVMRAKPTFFDSTPLGRIVNRFARDMESVDESASYALEMLASDFLGVITVLAIITATTPAFLGVAVVVSALYMAIGVYYLRTSRELKRLESTSMSPLLSLVGELISGVSSIRAFGASQWYVNEAAARIAAHNRPFYGVWCSNRWLSIRVDVTSAFVSFTCAVFVLRNAHVMDAGLAGFALAYALTFSGRMLFLIRNYGENELNMNAVERIEQYLRIEQEAPLHVSPPQPASWPATGNVRVENLVIEHVPGTPVLHDLTFTIKHSERIGVVGRTGAGKSTLSLALLRFIEAAKGQIFIDGVDIASVGLNELRRSVTIIPQDPVLFNGSIRFNLDPFEEYPDALIWDALKRAYLVRSDDNEAEQESVAFTSLDAEIKENGQNLSLGQRQLVAIARALVRRSRLVVLDEATASVDFALDSQIQRTIRGPEFADSTLLCIAHRLRTIIDYDRVLVLDKGRIAEFDTPWNLLQRPEGLFRSMCEKSGEFEHLLSVAEASQPPP